MVHWATQVNIPNGIMIDSAALQEFHGSDRQTNHYSICSNRPHLTSAVMRPKKQPISQSMTFNIGTHSSSQ